MIHGIEDDAPAPAKPKPAKVAPEAPDAVPAWARGGTSLKSRPMDNGERHVNGVSMPTVGGQVIAN